LSLNNETIVELIQNFEKQTKALKSELLKMCWYMRGGLTYDQALLLGTEERELIGEIIKENLEVSKKTGQPFF